MIGKVNRRLFLWNPKQSVSTWMFAVLYRTWPGVHVSARCVVSDVCAQAAETARAPYKNKQIAGDSRLAYDTP